MIQVDSRRDGKGLLFRRAHQAAVASPLAKSGGPPPIIVEPMEEETAGVDVRPCPSVV